MQYRTTGTRPRGIRPRISRSGETFSLGREALAKLCLVGGVLRLFLALDPKAYPAEKYHHRDYSEVVRYARYPMMIRLISDRQVRNALELIGEIMSARGLEADPDYRPVDQVHEFAGFCKVNGDSADLCRHCVGTGPVRRQHRERSVRQPCRAAEPALFFHV